MEFDNRERVRGRKDKGRLDERTKDVIIYAIIGITLVILLFAFIMVNKSMIWDYGEEFFRP